jgi:NADH:ubiquinone oxidoreductase subunit 3 (subunit A)
LGFLVVCIFLILLRIGFLYEINQGALNT